MAVIRRKIQPQPGYQTKALSNSADIVIGGAAAGVGKTFVLLLDPLRDINTKGFGGVIFRRTTTQIRNEGGLWDTSMHLYPYAGASPKESVLEWEWKNNNKLKFAHLEHEKNILDWQGAQIPYIGFDELTHFSRKMFFYLLSRNRSTCGVKPYVRATCNPDPESWVAEFISWWIDPDTGLPIPERDGVIRFLVVDGENYIWGDTVGEVIEKALYLINPQLAAAPEMKAADFVKSVSFVSGSIYDNKELLKVDPGYLANLLSQDEATKSSLLDGNWKAVLSDLDLYDYNAFNGIFDNVKPVDTNGRYVTADIAGKGSNMFVVGGWHGNELADIDVIAKSDGPEVIGTITAMAKKIGAQNRHICFDADGIGGLVDGWIPGAISFNGGSQPIEVKDPISEKRFKENYFNLKAQCFYRSAARVGRGEIKISEYAASKMYNDKMTIRQRFIHERKAIKRDKPDADGKLRIIPKEQMKAKLNGESPDLMDMFAMKEMFHLKQARVFADAAY